jgi:hypothetical protein
MTLRGKTEGALEQCEGGVPWRLCGKEGVPPGND